MEPAVGHGHPNVHTGTSFLCGVGRARTKSFNATVNVRSTNVGGSGASVRATRYRTAAVVLADATTILAAPAMSFKLTV